MALAVRWAEGAWDDLEQIVEFIASDSPAYAKAFIREARNTARSLKTLSKRGRIVPELNDSRIRELFIGSYRLIYGVSQEEVHVLGIVHGARDLVAVWDRRGTVSD